MTPDEWYRHCVELREKRAREVAEAAADNWRETHRGLYQIADRAVGQTDEALHRETGR